MTTTPSSPHPPSEGLLEVRDAEQFKALGHPARMRILLLLGQERATTSQLARSLQLAKGSVAHHLSVLERAGIVAVAEARQVRGGTERYWARTTQRIAVAGPNESAHAGVLLDTVAAELAAGPPPTGLTLRTLHLTPTQARALTQSLVATVDGAVDAGTAAPRYRLLVTVYESPGIAAEPPSA